MRCPVDTEGTQQGRMRFMSDTDSAPDSGVTITSLTDGPLEVAGEVEILAADGTLVKKTSKSYLCRCGHSAKKPFCDGSHKREGFSAP